MTLTHEGLATTTWLWAHPLRPSKSQSLRKHTDDISMISAWTVSPRFPNFSKFYKLLAKLSLRKGIQASGSFFVSRSFFFFLRNFSNALRYIEIEDAKVKHFKHTQPHESYLYICKIYVQLFQCWILNCLFGICRKII